MSNTPSWLSRWARSPRQDRRVIEDGKFVELGKIHDETIVEEQAETNTALGVVHEPVDTGASAGGDVQDNDSIVVRGNGNGPVENSNGLDQSTETGIAENVSDSVVPTPEEQTVSETSQVELEPLPGDGNLTVAKYEESLSDEESDALAETMRLPELTEDNDILF